MKGVEGLLVLILVGMVVMFGLKSEVDERKAHPEIECEIRFVKHSSGLCLAMCWGGTTEGGPAMTAVDEKYCDKETKQ